MKPTIAEGIIAVANHKLRIEGVESYKEFLAEEYFSKKEIIDTIKSINIDLDMPRSQKTWDWIRNELLNSFGGGQE